MTGSSFSIKLNRRIIIAISSYFALGLVAFFGMVKGSQHPELHSQILILQAVQFAIFSIYTSLFSIKNKVSLSSTEAWNFFPVIVFFYGQEYYFLDKISDNYATIFSVSFAAFLLLLYKIAERKLKPEKLASAGVIATTCTLIFAHSIFIVRFNDLTRVIFSFVIVGILAFFKEKAFKNETFKGPIILVTLMLLWGYFSVLLGIGNIGDLQLLLFGLLFGLVALGSSAKAEQSQSSLILYMAHAQVFVSIYRLEKYIGNFAIAPLWVAYAFAILFWAQIRKGSFMAKGAVPLVLIALTHFVVVSFSKLGAGQRVLSLLIMGGLIYAGGYIYRKAVKN